MTLHMGVVALAAPLLAFGIAGTRLDPVRRLPTLFAPLVACLLEFVVVWSWHVPALHHAARRTALGFASEQATFLLASLFVWLSCVGGRDDGAQRSAAGVLALLLTFMHMMLLGALLALAQRPLYPHAHRFAGLSPLGDQHLGGAIMIVGGVSYLLGGLGLTAGLVRQRVIDAPERGP
jgi:putative membrane protein